MKIKTVKFGGTSLCDANRMRKAADIVLSDPERQVVVVSAPGKRFQNDEKITDLLYQCYDETDPQARHIILQKIRKRLDEIITSLSLPLDFSQEYASLAHSAGSLIGRDYFASRGEYLCAKIFASLLGFSFIDAAECIFFREDGSFDATLTKQTLSEKLSVRLPVVIPGFYGRMPNHTIKTFPRGGSDITGAIVAGAIHADLYENFTDVSGLLLADPKIIESPPCVDIISYKELRKLSNMGAVVLHEDAVFPVRLSGIPINIRNTERPHDPGSLIVPNKPKTGTVSGIAGKAGYALIRISRDRIGEDTAAMRTLLGILERRDIPVFETSRSIDFVGIVVDSRRINGKKDYILNEICHAVFPEAVMVIDGIALIGVVGEKIGADRIAAVFEALAHIGENALLIDGGADEIGITVGVREESLYTAIRAIHEEILKRESLS